MARVDIVIPEPTPIYTEENLKMNKMLLIIFYHDN